jgi:hypothetical protein
MGTEEGQNWYQSIMIYSLAGKCLLPWLGASKCTKDAENVIYALLVMVSIGAPKRTLAGNRLHHNRSLDTNFDPPLFPLDRIFNAAGIKYCQQTS